MTHHVALPPSIDALRLVLPPRCPSQPYRRTPFQCRLRKRRIRTWGTRLEKIEHPLRWCHRLHRLIHITLIFSIFRDAGNPIRVEVGLGQCFVDARLVGAESAATLQQKRDGVEGRPLL